MPLRTKGTAPARTVTPSHLTPHSLRRSYASLLYAIGATPPRVMAQMGHTSPQLALSIYAREMDRRDGEPERLEALINGHEWGMSGDNASADRDTAVSATFRESGKPRVSRQLRRWSQRDSNP